MLYLTVPDKILAALRHLDLSYSEAAENLNILPSKLKKFAKTPCVIAYVTAKRIKFYLGNDCVVLKKKTLPIKFRAKDESGNFVTGDLLTWHNLDGDILAYQIRSHVGAGKYSDHYVDRDSLEIFSHFDKTGNEIFKSI